MSDDLDSRDPYDIERARIAENKRLLAVVIFDHRLNDQDEMAWWCTCGKTDNDYKTYTSHRQHVEAIVHYRE